MSELLLDEVLMLSKHLCNYSKMVKALRCGKLDLASSVQYEHVFLAEHGHCAL